MTISFTSYFEEQVLRKRPYIKKEWCIEAVQSPVKKVVQKDGRIRYWIYVPEMAKYLRVITLEDGLTVHNAFPDRDFESEAQS